MKYKNLFLALLLIIAGILVGMLVANATSGVTALSWLSRSINFGFNYGNASPLIDFNVIKINFGFALNINISEIIFILIGLLIYKKVR